MQNFDLNGLANMPGVIHKRFCTFCTEEAQGDLTADDIRIPVCEDCRDKVLDNGLASMLD